MSKFKVGDKVKIRDGIKIGGYYNGYDFIESMDKYKGKKLEISEVLLNNRNKIKEDNGMCTYTDDMLELVTITTKQPKYVKCIDNSCFREELKVGEVYKIKEVYKKRYDYEDGYELEGEEHSKAIYCANRFETVSTPKSFEKLAEKLYPTINKKSTIKIRQTGNITYATYNSVHSGEAIRRLSDDYDESIGILLATARALNIDSDKIKGIIDVLFDESKKEVELSNADIYKDSDTNLDFKIGDRVIGLGSVDDKTINGIKGTIIDLYSHSKYKYGIKFDKDIDGHDLHGNCDWGYGYWVRKEDIKLLSKDEEEIAKLQEENKELNDTINKIKSLLLSNDIIKDNTL